MIRWHRWSCMPRCCARKAVEHTGGPTGGLQTTAGADISCGDTGSLPRSNPFAPNQKRRPAPIGPAGALNEPLRGLALEDGPALDDLVDPDENTDALVIRITRDLSGKAAVADIVPLGA